MAALFPQTHWSRLEGLGDKTDEERIEALRWFARHYWQPVYHYVHGLRRCTKEEAEDLTQGFFSSLLDRGDLLTLSPSRGSVRAFLKIALRNFVFKASRADGVRHRLFPLVDADEDLAPDPAPSPEEAFDRAWIRKVLRDAMAHLRRQLEADGRQQQFAMFEAYCVNDDEPVTYEQLAVRFAMKPEDVRNRVRDTRHRLIEIIRALVSEYVGTSDEIKSELGFILGET